MGHSVVQLTPAEHALVRTLIAQVLPDAVVMIFGSRATGRARPHSDLDLLFVQPPRLSWQQQAELRDRFEASLLPFRVDLVGAEDLAEGYRQRVAAEAIPL